MRIAVLASGFGSNLRALLAARDAGTLPIDIVGVGSDKPDCGAVASAREAGLPVFAQRPATFADRAAFDAALFTAIEHVQPDVIVCAGYMRLLGKDAVRRTQGRMINLHPSLLPAYPGLHTHARALADGAAEHGASVHVVTEDLDAGPVLAQARVNVEMNDTAATLADRVRGREHPLLCAVIADLANGDLVLAADAPPRWRGVTLARPLRLGDDNRWMETA
ncbi:MAG: phosphoribosylglycinamide formyltransferase [Arenimonas sp.]